MAYMRLNLRSESLAKYVDVSIVFPTDGITAFGPECKQRPRIHPGKGDGPVYCPGMKFQTIYLIHGGGDDDSLPFRYTNIERYAQQNRVMIVAPDVSNSFGADTEYGMDYCLFITEELPRIIQSLFASSPRREDTYIVGFAMGGNVALSCALRRPDLYNTCVDMSGGIGYTLCTDTFKTELEGDHFRNNFYLYNSTFGPANQIDGSRHDLRTIAVQQKKSGCKLCNFIIIAGSEEGFIRTRVEGDADALEKLGYPVRYICEPGGKHDMDLWDKYLRILLDDMLPLRRNILMPEIE